MFSRSIKQKQNKLQISTTNTTTGNTTDTTSNTNDTTGNTTGNTTNTNDTTDNTSNTTDNTSNTNDTTDTTNQEPEYNSPSNEIAIGSMTDHIYSVKHKISHISKNSTIVHPYSKKTYIYDPVIYTAQTMDDIFTEEDAIYNVHLCIYNINTIIPQNPYLSYLLMLGQPDNKKDQEKKDYEYNFPTFRYINENIDIINQTEIFTSKCLEQYYKLYNFVPKESTTNKDIENMSTINGFITVNNDIYVFIYATQNKLPEQSINKFGYKSKYVYATMHEIINTNQIFDIPINININILFNENPDLIYIRDSQEIPIDIPYIMYPITNKEQDNNNNTNKEQYETKIGHSIVIPKINGPYGSYYYFSNDIINNQKYENCSRYVILERMLIYKSCKKDYYSIYYQYKDDQNNIIPIWGIRTVDMYSIL